MRFLLSLIEALISTILLLLVLVAIDYLFFDSFYIATVVKTQTQSIVHLYESNQEKLHRLEKENELLQKEIKKLQ